MYEPTVAVDAGFLDDAVDADSLAEAALTEAQRWATLPRAAYRGQVLMNRGECLDRLAEAIAHDRSQGFDVPS